MSARLFDGIIQFPCHGRRRSPSSFKPHPSLPPAHTTMFDLALSNVHTFISGSSGGIGLETVQAFLEQDALVSAHFGSNRGPLEQYEGNERVAIVGGDVRDEHEVDRMFEESRARLGRPIEVLVGEICIYGPLSWLGHAESQMVNSLDQSSSQPRVYSSRKCTHP